MPRIVAVIDGSFESLLCVVFSKYYEKLQPEDVVLSASFQQCLDADYVEVPTDFEKARRVYSALEKISVEITETVHLAFANQNENKLFDIYQYMILVFQKGSFADNCLTLSYVLNVHQMARNSGREAHHMMGFVRFSETTSNVLYSEIAPANDVLPIVAHHFTERLISLPWIIHDLKRKKAAVYDTHKLVIAETNGTLNFTLSSDETLYQDLWVQFIKSIAIENRYNPKLQQQLLPRRYRPFMVEFK